MVRSLLIFLLFFSADRASATSVADLCQQDIEGTYQGLFTKTDSFRIELYCLSGDRIIATIGAVDTSSGSYLSWAYLSFSGIDGDDLILANFKFAAGLRDDGSSKASLSYLRVSIADLLKGALKGSYTGKFLDNFIPVSTSRVKQFPRFTPSSLNPPRGMFVVQQGAFSGAHILFDVLDGVPVMSLEQKSSGIAIKLSDGDQWRGDGLLSVATAHGNGGESDDPVLNYLRGRFRDANTLDFYLVIPQNGLMGPYTATRP